MRPPAVTFKLPETDERLTNTMQLAYCLAFLRTPQPFDDPLTQNWLQTTGTDTNEQGRLILIATEMIRAFKRDGLEDAKAVAEVACLAPVLEKDDFRHLKELYLAWNSLAYWIFVNYGALLNRYRVLIKDTLTRTTL
ncbi:MAG: hypothetical protein J3Q66DRAFT_403469 [Benniella sp.]|nr:MAG: hypothetical protein J3Q66DRAFT_403469 [Benniella sp.]